MFYIVVNQSLQMPNIENNTQCLFNHNLFYDRKGKCYLGRIMFQLEFLGFPVDKVVLNIFTLAWIVAFGIW